MNYKNYIIKTEDICFEYNSVKALQSISIEITSGTIFGFLGPNGAGKTTTIRILLGLLKPSSGKASVFGLDTLMESESIRQQCGVLSEHNGLYEVLSAQDNLRFYGKIWKIPKSTLEERIKELLTHIGLWERRTENVNKWSKGMKQRLAIARCFLHHPSLIFLDEPTSGLDPEAASLLRKDLLRMVEKEGTSIFLTTHNLDEAEKICNQVGVINKGKLLALGSPSELISQNEIKYYFEIKGKDFSDYLINALELNPQIKILSNTNGILKIEVLETENISTIISQMVSTGAGIFEVKRILPSLEKIYLTIMEENQ